MRSIKTMSGYSVLLRFYAVRSFGLLLAVFTWGLLVSPNLFGRTVYVAINGLSLNSYSNWTDAATNIQMAVNVASNSDTVMISNGTYNLTNQVVISTNITLRSINNNPSAVIVKGDGANRCFSLSGNNAMLVGLTITNGRISDGAGVYVGGGSAILTNCIISGNTNTSWGGGVSLGAPTRIANCVIGGNAASNGGGIYFGNTNSIVVNSTISRNFAFNQGGGVNFGAISATSLVNCVISENTSSAHGGGLYINVAGAGREIARNCLIVSNVGSIGGVYYAGGGVGDLAACTIVANSSPGGSLIGNIGMEGPGGSAGVVRDCIIYGGSAPGFPYRVDVYLWYTAYTNNFINCCIGVNALEAYPINLAFGSMIANPQFATGGVYRLSSTSPCVNAGTNLTWMDGALDLDGHNRIDRFNRRVDIGAYEFLRSGVMIKVKGR